MHLRAAEWADIPRITDITLAAFNNDELNTWLFTRGNEMPYTRRSVSNRRVRSLLLSPGVTAFVTVTDEQDPPAWPRDVVVGYACWERAGEHKQPSSETSSGYLAALERKLLGLEKSYVKFSHTDQCVDRQRFTIFNKENELLGDIFAPLKEYRKLEILAVDPAWQGKGVAKRLMQWAFDRCKEEAVPIILIASVAGRPLYKALGFKVVGWAVTESSSSWAEGGSIMVWDPTGTLTREAVREETERMYYGRARKIDAVYTPADRLGHSSPE